MRWNGAGLLGSVCSDEIEIHSLSVGERSIFRNLSRGCGYVEKTKKTCVLRHK